ERERAGGPEGRGPAVHRDRLHVVRAHRDHPSPLRREGPGAPSARPARFAASRGSLQPTGRTFAACGPFWPCVTSNSTFWFSSRLRYPEPVIALKCTNTSGPPSSWEMKPYPFSGLNHLTVPVLTSNPLLSCSSSGLIAARRSEGPEAQRELRRAAWNACRLPYPRPGL